MKTSIFMISLLILQPVQGQTRTGFEAYYYTCYSGTSAIVPKAYFQSNGWYGEARYNYESGQSLSLFAGRTFSKENLLSWSFTPMIGVVAGQLRGGSLGVNAALNIKGIYFNTASQYTASWHDRNESFFYAWSELGYQLTEHIYAGAALQQTGFCGNGNSLEPGLQLTLSSGSWRLPVYLFSSRDKQLYLVAGINREWTYGQSKTHKSY
ncbi:MAG TPA: hypothetical protein VI233_05275 [Puia sp.]